MPLPPESALLESRSLRESVLDRTETLTKVKALAVLPDGVHVTSQGIADYFEVDREVVKKLVQRHRAELKSNGMRVLRGSDLQRFEGDNLSLSKLSYPQGRSNLSVFTRRAVLNVAMLLRDSEVARRVRTYLLDAEGAYRAPVQGSIDAIVVRLAEAAAERVTAPKFAEVNARLDAHGRVVCAMSERLCQLGDDMREMRQDMAEFRQDLAEIRSSLARQERRRRRR